MKLGGISISHIIGWVLVLLIRYKGSRKLPEGVKVEKELFEKDLGKYAKVDASLQDGVAVIAVKIPLESIVEDAIDPLLEKLKGIIPGNWDDAMIDGAKAAVRSSFGLGAAPAVVAEAAPASEEAAKV